MDVLPYLLDLAGTFVFGLSGAMAGVKHRLDLFGVLVLSFAAANTGGITRDVLIGAIPPGAINNWHYLVRMIGSAPVSTRTYWRYSPARPRDRRFRRQGASAYISRKETTLPRRQFI